MRSRAFVASIVFLFASVIFAQSPPTPAGPERTLGKGDFASVAAAGDQYIAVWGDSTGQILGRKFTADNLGPTFVIGQAGYSYYGPAAKSSRAAKAIAPNAQVNPAYFSGASPDVAGDNNGDFVVVWPESDGYGSFISGRLFGSTNRSFSEGGECNADDPAVSMNRSTGEFVVVWQECGDIVFETHDSSGSSINGQFVSYGYDPDVAMDSSGNFIVVWNQYGTVLGQAFDINGYSLGSYFPLSSGTSYSNYHPQVAATRGGDFVVAWEKGYYAGKNLNGGGGGISARRFSNMGAGGTPVSSDFAVASGNVGDVSISGNGAGDFVIAWTSGYSSYTLNRQSAPGATTEVATEPLVDTSGAGVVGQLYNDDGTRIGSNFQLNTTTAGDQVYPGVGLSGSGIGTVWTSSPNVMEQVFSTLCPGVAPGDLSPASGATVAPGPVTFTWSAVPSAVLYTIYIGVGGANPVQVAQTSDPSYTMTVPEGVVSWIVSADFAGVCRTRSSEVTRFTAGTTPPPPPTCESLDAPIPSVVAEQTTGETYTLSWTEIEGAVSYEVLEGSSAAFIDATSFVATDTSLEFKHSSLTTPTPYFYKVRAMCDVGGAGPFSEVLRVVGLPKPAPSATNPQIVTEFDNTMPVDTELYIPGFSTTGAKVAPMGATFSVSSNESWLTVSPANGALPSGGVVVTLTADPTMVGFGANTATVTVTRNDGLAKTTLGGTTGTVPVSVSLVSPVTPLGPGSTPPSNALIIPAVANITGATQKWLSDVKISNTSNQAIQYKLSFKVTGKDGAQQGKSTSYSLRPGQTVAMDDIVRQWFGFGDLADGTAGAIEIRPLNFTGKVGSSPEATLAATVATSRTYTRDPNSLASFGQFIPSTAFSKFVSGQLAGAVLSMQQISQNADMRSNFGLLEGSGKPVDVLMTIYDATGNKLGEFPVSLKGGEHRQLNSLLAANNITVTDGRMEVKITSGAGAITSYASVVVGGTGDPTYIQGVDPHTISASRYVLPGIADLHAGGATWRSDVRIFNGGTQSQLADLYFYQQGSTTPKGPVPVIVNPGEVKVLQNVVNSIFGLSDTGGALHIETASTSSLVTTGETFDSTNAAGKFGQFIPGITPDQAVGTSDRALQVLQVEDSTQFRTNLGLAEMSGKPATVQVQLIIPNSLVAPVTTVQLGANEFKQLNGVARSLAGKDVYNGRLSVKVLSGDGKITAYGSVVDNKTLDATYVPGQ